MQPTINIDTSAKTLNIQADIKVAKVEENIDQDY